MTPHLSRRTVIGAGAALGVTALPTLASAAPASDWVGSTLARMSLEQKVGQLFITYGYGPSATAPDERNQARYGVPTMAEVVTKYHLGGVIYFGWSDNVASPEQVHALSAGLQEAARAGGLVPLQIATDQEMGIVTRIGPPATQLPGSMALGAAREPGLAMSAATITGRELRAMGVNVNFAPCSDVNVNPANPVIGVRSFSSRPDLVAELAAAQVAGYQAGGWVASSTKHFPGHGDTTVDSHTGLPVITHSRQEWEQTDLPPFRRAIAAKVDMVMTAHLLVPALDGSGDPATLSKPILTGILRRELGYQGVVVTDSLEMAGVRQRYRDDEIAVRALEAGVDQLLMPADHEAAWAGVLQAVRSGRLSEQEIDEKVRRVLTLKERRGIIREPSSPRSRLDQVGTAEHRQAADAIAKASVTLVKNDSRVLPLRPQGRRVLVTGFGVTTTATVGAELTGRGSTVRVLQTGTAPTEAQTAEAVAAAQACDLVLVLTSRAWSSPGQVRLVERLLATGRPVVVVAVRDPYDISHFPAASTYLCTYSYSPVSLPALVAVLTGEYAPTGKLPVDIPAADGSRVLFPFGHGLSY
ncbi:MAG: glycoside hydrolase family 3 protein [Actinomycetia bacterium]|nr:glycoside hydrolase family 3 protein [Actinomycetes bacterium]